MDTGTALSELGLKVLPSARELKRFYLKAVRQHPPERDPDGFRRVRAAYEFLLTLATVSSIEPSDDWREEAATEQQPVVRVEHSELDAVSSARVSGATPPHGS